MSYYPHTTEAELKTKIEAFKFTYLSRGNFEIGFENIETEQPVVVIHGHGDAGEDKIGVGEEVIKIESMVSKLKDAGLKNNATIKLNACYSACLKSKVDYSIKEVYPLPLKMRAFRNGEPSRCRL